MPFGFFKRRRRRRLLRQPFPSAWLAVIERRVPYYRLLTPEERARLCGHVQVFLAEKRFEGCGGLAVTDEMRVVIAALACLLILNIDQDYYPQMRTVLVYPRGYVVDDVEHLPDGSVLEGPEPRVGESWHRGPVVLAWDDVVRSIRSPHDGYNVVFHEFAHQLDSEFGGVDGAPALSDRAAQGNWARVLGREYRRLQRDLGRRRSTLFDAYGASDPAEFFAVVTETFFEKPLAMRGRHAALYEALKQFYRQDPAGRTEAARGERSNERA